MTMEILPALWLAAAAIGVGILVGSTGIGGFLIIPALTLFAGVPIRVAMGTALVAAAANGALGAWLFHRRGNIDWTLAAPLAGGSVLFALFGAWLNRWLPVALIVAALGLVMFVGSIATFFNVSRRASAGSLASAPAPGRARLVALIAIGCLSGLVAGLTGAGGPLVSVPLMAMLAYPTLIAVGAGQVLQLVASASAAIPYSQAGHVSVDAAIIIVPAQLIGIRIGVGLAHVVDPRIAARVVAGVGAAAGLFILSLAAS